MLRKFFLSLVFLIRVVDAVESSSNWLVESGEIDPHNYFGVTLANGMIGLVSSSNPMETSAVILNGIYDSYGRGRVSNILQTFNPTNIKLEIDGRRVKTDEMSDYSQMLDMKRAVLISRFNVGDKLAVTHSIMALRHLPYSSLITITLTAKKDLVVTPMSIIQAPFHLSDVRNFYSEVDRPHVRIPLLTSAGKSPSGKHMVAVSNTYIFLDPHGQEPSLIHEDWDHNKHLVKFNKTLLAGETYSFSIVSSFTSSKHYQDPINEVERLSIYAALEGTDRLINRHEAEWKKLWKSDIVIENDLQAQHDVRLALYHLYSFVREGTAYSLSPMGLSGLGYNGHIFWDAELWMFPPLLILHPELAKSLLEYRFERLEAAKRNAYAHGYKGAMFPWESAEDGMEETPVWALTGPFQHHITGCIGWACWKYYQVTQDKQWLRDKGYPILKEVADFWASRVERNGPGRFEINNVIGANEWQENIDNNAFTNGMAITSLQYAIKAAEVLGIAPDPDWDWVAQNIPILRFPDGTTKENSTYLGEVIKQADVNLLSYPLEVIVDPAAIERDLKYYEPLISSEGPAMGYAILSVLYSRLGNIDKAYELFVKSYEPNKKMPFGVISERPNSKNPYFCTGAGGMLQAILFGFCGLSITDEGIQQSEPCPPTRWKSIGIMRIREMN